MAGAIDLGKYTYKRIKLKSPDGRVIYSANNADAVSRAMLMMTKDDLIRTATDNRLGTRLKKHFEKNTGHLRMIVGQALRSEIHKGKTITVRGIKIDSLRQEVEWPLGYVERPRREAACS